MRFAVPVVCVLVLFEKVGGHHQNQLDFGDDVLDYKLALEFVEGCGSKNLTLCLKKKLLKYMEDIPSEIDIGEGLKIKPNSEGRRSRQQARSRFNESEIREEDLDKLLTNKFTDYVYSHQLEYKVPQGVIEELRTAVEEGRKKKGGGEGMGMKQLLLLFKIKAAIIGVIALKLIGLVAFKALLMAKIAFTIATIITLKNLVVPKHSSSTYEVHAVPSYLDEHSPYERLSLI